MKNDKQSVRRQQIEAAAYQVLTEKGYRGASMLEIAKQASASNETLYRWYGNKQTLFASLVHENTREVRELLDKLTNADIDPGLPQLLDELGTKLLRLVTGERAVALNRAAVGDVFETAQLGKTIAQGGRSSVAPLIASMFDRYRNSGHLSFDNPTQVAGIYISLLIGDLQIQRVIGARASLTAREAKDRATSARALIIKLYGTAKLKQRR